ncbi:MAG: glutaredoxin [Pseudohongiellaceae bacterium]|jgi:hypothetical protein
MLKFTIRKIIDSFLSLFDWFNRPQPIARSEEESRKLAKATSGLALYDYKGCMASRKTRHEIRRLNIDIERRDIGKCTIHQDNLLAEFGKLKAPCLRIEEKGEVHWIDEPEKIVFFLHDRFDVKDEGIQYQKSA